MKVWLGVGVVVLTWSNAAVASTCSNNVASTKSCFTASSGTRSVGLADSDVIDGYGQCGTSTQYPSYEEIIRFTCTGFDRVAFRVTPTECNLDVFVLEGDCAACDERSQSSSLFAENVVFDCAPGEEFFVVVERDWASLDTINPFSDCYAQNSWSYDYAITCSPYEDCEDGVDNDGDFAIDCVDLGCATHPACCDLDGDGALGTSGSCGGDDCDDTDPLVFPGATEGVADGVDQNCDGVDRCYRDSDGDGYGRSNVITGTTVACDGAGEAANDDDCDDFDANQNPGEPERPGNFKDDDCDGLELCYVDVDNDGYGDGTLVTSVSTSCGIGDVARNTGDCAVFDPNIHPFAPEVVGNGVDENCDGALDCYVDADGDAVGANGSVVDVVAASCDVPGASSMDGDCDDSLSTVFVGAPEVPANGVDEDCDGREVCFADQDGDGVGAAPVSSASLTCVGPNISASNADCNDLDVSIVPGATEGIHDGVDQNCDGFETCPIDGDGDGVAGPTTGSSSDLTCTSPPFADQVGDCDDGNAAAYPGNVEVPGDGIDNDCVDGDASPLVLRGPIPGVAGRNNNFEVTGALPGAGVVLVAALAPGTFDVPGCPGLQLPMSNPVVLSFRNASPAGTSQATVFAPAFLANVFVGFAAVDIAACEASNLNVGQLQ